ncbi:uncharacterized protein MYCGRDRAFT_102855 [Zymoseptoria tritici IPO323]|uniref:Uncharacterized protein n=1 Tax=Zymoseptoria tritici (strain CBS 115943 / IPO323) TaxID=336722 RepID=F9X0K0_ZYMTI|nr:uncharacterized protein MYCGRDRAFT_102855 [Zymoseptoria tritici IPO323]EGP91636.1 hypothetical protein MYCGRDRAFT_102855 [Zymoseptoria tritici IPO323]
MLKVAEAMVDIQLSTVVAPWAWVALLEQTQHLKPVAKSAKAIRAVLSQDQYLVVKSRTLIAAAAQVCIGTDFVEAVLAGGGLGLAM